MKEKDRLITADECVSCVCVALKSTLTKIDLEMSWLYDSITDNDY